VLVSIKQALRRTPLAPLYRQLRQQQAERAWLRAGRPAPPPPIVKQRIVRGYGTRFALRVFVETGTDMGDMIEAVRLDFDTVYSIELGADRYRNAVTRFAGAPHVTILQGDSGEVLATLLPQIEAPCLFWLDAHYSRGTTARGSVETPIVAELRHIFGHPLAHRHVILIDDARCFTGADDYPRVAAIEHMARSAGFDSFEVEEDIMRIYRQSNGHPD
jgi:hypothetical protein